LVGVELQDGANGTVDLMTEWERSFMDSDKYLDDWFIEDEVLDALSESEYEVYMMECGEEYELG
jgi:hypothetical protein